MNQVEIPKSHRNEWKSKRDFEDLIQNLGLYMPFGWAICDYGIDGQVEITRPIKDSDSFSPESKFFLIQLKAQEKIRIFKKFVSFSIPVKKVIQWYSANLPVMFILYDLKNKVFYSIWIDERLIATLENTNSTWVNQKEITLKIPLENNFCNYTLDTIRDYVLHWKVPIKGIIQPGLYFELKERCNENLISYNELTKSFNFESVNNSLETLNNQIEQAIYRIVITGPSRVGKSSLINALLRRRDISPTGIFQTTGVPIQILPGKSDLIKISFKDGSAINKDFSKTVIESYASQSKNEDNKKEVALISIYLVNRQLEHGVSFFDIPGLDDPDDNICNYTWSTVTKANAILYLIDASPFENGGYIFKNEYKKHILELGQTLDKIFLVFTKINALSGNKLPLLQERVIQDLKKYNLFDKVSGKIYFLSAEESLEIRLKKKKGNDSVQKLEEDIWAYLLKENKVGLANLNFINRDLINSIKDFEGILNARLFDNEKRGKLNDAIETVKVRIPDLTKLYFKREEEFRKGISRFIENHKHNLLSELEKYLNSFPIHSDLPGKKEIQNYLSQGGHKTLQQTNIEYAHQVNMLKDMIDNWIEENLKQVREILTGNSEQKVVDFSELEKFDLPTIDLSTSFGVGIFTSIVGLIVYAPAALLVGLAGFFGSLLMSADERRAKRIDNIMNSARKCYQEQFKKINEAYMDLVKEHSKLIIDYANKKIKLFFSDLQNQMSHLGNKISEEELEQYKVSFGKITELRNSINKLDEEIISWYNSIK
ncbi:MAG TPA: dynamin family protein [Bacteroidales bacterium]